MWTNLGAIALVATIALGTPSYAQPKTSPNLGRLAWSAFQCSVFAEMAGDAKEQERLFQVGYLSSQKYVGGIKNKTISEAEARGAPIGLLALLAGPTIDFISGRIFENATQDAFDAVVKTKVDGTTIYNPSEWVNDDRLKQARARAKYVDANCELLR